MKTPHFDSLIDAVRRNTKNGYFAYTLKNAKLFYFSDSACQDIRKRDRIGSADLSRLYLPFDIVAFEIDAGAIMVSNHQHMDDDYVEVVTYMDLGDGKYQFLCGIVTKDLTQVSLHQLMGFEGGALKVSKCFEENEMYPDIAEQLRVWVITFVVLLEEINNKDKFILECTPKSYSDQGKKGKPLKGSMRPVYTVVDPSVIRKTMRTEPSEEKRSFTGRDVRGHWRTYRSERYINKRGSTVWIKAHWSGPQESIVGNKKYKVRIDL